MHKKTTQQITVDKILAAQSQQYFQQQSHDIASSSYLQVVRAKHDILQALSSTNLDTQGKFNALMDVAFGLYGLDYVDEKTIFAIALESLKKH